MDIKNKRRFIYRVELDDGGGPYRYNGLDPTKWQNRAHTNDTHPGPYEDGLKGNVTRFQSGFVSLADLMAWFNEDERRSLISLGFKLSVYSVDAEEIKVLGRQVVFVRRDKDLALRGVLPMTRCLNEYLTNIVV